MKKFFVPILTLILLIGCCACGKHTDLSTENAINSVFPANSSFCGIILDGMTADEAKQAVADAVAGYTLTVVLDENDTIVYTTDDLNMTAAELDYAALLESVLNQEEVSPELISYDLSDVQRNLERKNRIRKKPKNAYVSYDEEKQLFVLNDEVAGTVFNEEAVLRAVEIAVGEMQPGITILGTDVFKQPEVTADSQKAKDALKAANAMLDVSLTYTYKTTDQAELIDRELISSWLMVGEDGLLVEIVPAQLSAYVSEMEEKHSTSSGTVEFQTTSGGSITLNVASAGQTVDTDALYNDIAECVTNGVSGEREAPYVVADTDAGANFGGTYVEINLSAQHLWVYSKGECVVSTDIVSGGVSNGCATPTGLFTIKSRETDRYLVGDGYKSWVNYWMPFNGGIGLHDADGWRSAYGGTIYHYNGSHGCINMPKSAAAATYSYVSVGTYVIVYGGDTSVSGGGASSEQNTDPCATGHTWNGGTVTTEATCVAEGTMTYTCSECGENKTESIATIAHSYSSGSCVVCDAKDPTYTPPVESVPDTPSDSGTDTTPDVTPDDSTEVPPDDSEVVEPELPSEDATTPDGGATTVPDASPEDEVPPDDTLENPSDE